MTAKDRHELALDRFHVIIDALTAAHMASIGRPDPPSPEETLACDFKALLDVAIALSMQSAALQDRARTKRRQRPDARLLLVNPGQNQDRQTGGIDHAPRGTADESLSARPHFRDRRRVAAGPEGYVITCPVTRPRVQRHPGKAAQESVRRPMNIAAGLAYRVDPEVFPTANYGTCTTSPRLATSATPRTRTR